MFYLPYYLSALNVCDVIFSTIEISSTVAVLRNNSLGSAFTWNKSPKLPDVFLGKITILPKNTAGSFGDLFQVKAEPNELFISTATVNDISIVEKITSQTLRTDR